MPRTCAVCIHSRRSEINQALSRGEPYRQLSRSFGVHIGVLKRHRQHVGAEHAPVPVEHWPEENAPEPEAETAVVIGGFVPPEEHHASKGLP